MAGLVARVLLGVVDRICAFSGDVSCAYQSWSVDPRVRAWCDDRACVNVLCLVLWAGGSAIDLELNGGRMA